MVFHKCLVTAAVWDKYLRRSGEIAIANPMIYIGDSEFTMKTRFGVQF